MILIFLMGYSHKIAKSNPALGKSCKFAHFEK